MSHVSPCFQQKSVFMLVEYLTSLHEIYPVKHEFAGVSGCNDIGRSRTIQIMILRHEASKSYPDSIRKSYTFQVKRETYKTLSAFRTSQVCQYSKLVIAYRRQTQEHHNGRDGQPRSRYLESVNAVMAAKQHGGFRIGVAFNPFKYVEAERDAQYLKLHKKIKAGADFIIANWAMTLKP